MSFRHRTLGILLITVLSFSVGLGAEQRITGTDRALWVVKTTGNGESFAAFYRIIDTENWKPAVSEYGGSPHLIQAVGEQLHVLYKDGQYLLFDYDGNDTFAKTVPGRPLVACESTGLEGDKPSLLFAVRRENTLDGVEDDGQAPPEEHSNGPRLCLYRSDGITWKPLGCGDLPAEPIALAELKGRVYLLGNMLEKQSSPPEDDSQTPPPDNEDELVRDDSAEAASIETPAASAAPTAPPKLWVLEGRDWQPLPHLPTDRVQKLFETGRPLGMVGVSGRLVVLVADPQKAETTPAEHEDEGESADDPDSTREDAEENTPEPDRPDLPELSDQPLRIRLVVYDPVKKTFSEQTLQQNDERMSFPPDSRPQVTRMGDNIVVGWMKGQTLQVSYASQAGIVRKTEDLEAKLSEMPDEKRIQKLMEYYIWGVMIAVVLSLVALRPKTPPRLFSLPETIQAGSLFKRALAIVIDFLPISTAVNLLLLRNMEFNWEDVRKIAEGSQVPPVEAMYAFMIAIGLYILYGIGMEVRFGATLGKMAMKLRVVSDGGRKTELREAALRNLFKAIELPMLLSGWWAILPLLPVVFTRNRQRFGDMIAKTAVVEKASLDRTRETTPSGEASGYEIGPLEASEEPGESKSEREEEIPRQEASGEGDGETHATDTPPEDDAGR